MESKSRLVFIMFGHEHQFGVGVRGYEWKMKQAWTSDSFFRQTKMVNLNYQTEEI